MIEIKQYRSHEKYRCVLTSVFDPMYAYNLKRSELSRRGLTPREVDALCGSAPLNLTKTQLILRALSYAFDNSRKGSYVPNRFNTSDIAALYTGKDDETAYMERRHHWSPSNSSHFTIFSIIFSGAARDIRKQIEDGTLPFPESYGSCQGYAIETLAAGLHGIVAPSKRKTGSSCCTLFSETSVISGRQIRDGQFR